MTEKVLFNILFPFYLITLATSVQPAGATGSDISKECRWSEQIVDGREYGLLFPEVPGRFDAALDYLDDYGYKKSHYRRP